MARSYHFFLQEVLKLYLKFPPNMFNLCRQKQCDLMLWLQCWETSPSHRIDMTASLSCRTNSTKTFAGQTSCLYPEYLLLLLQSGANFKSLKVRWLQSLVSRLVVSCLHSFYSHIVRLGWNCFAWTSMYKVTEFQQFQSHMLQQWYLSCQLQKYLLNWQQIACFEESSREINQGWLL